MSSGDSKKGAHTANGSNQNPGQDNNGYYVEENGGYAIIKNGSDVKLSPSASKPKSPKSASSPQKDSAPSDSPNVSFEELQMEEAMKGSTLSAVMQKMRTHHYSVKEDRDPEIFGKCKSLYEEDYTCKVVNNANYCLNYPPGIIVPLKKKTDTEGSSMEFDSEKYEKLVKEAPEARIRSRFVVPVMLFDNKFICRSGTLTVWLTATYEKATKAAPMTTSVDVTEEGGIISDITNIVTNIGSSAIRSFQYLSDWNVMEPMLKNDVAVLKHLKIGRICDLMVEYSKVKAYLTLSSTEKECEELYKDFKLEEMPFPGCEFFADYHKENRKAKGLWFDWQQTEVTRKLKLTEEVGAVFPEVQSNIQNFKAWDLVQLTQNYLKIILSFLVTGTDGIVFHCISGWDRTPTFVTLIRLSLWADGVIHESLKYEDMAYLAVVYDWYLFGHNLPDRIQKNEEVMHFCFNFLENITSDEFSVTRIFKELPDDLKKNRVFPEFVPGRRTILNKIRTLVLELYDRENIEEEKAPKEN